MTVLTKERFGMRKTLSRLLAFGLLFPTLARADVINVPADQPTIQAGIDAASDGDEVVVAMGTYNETAINFNGKTITLRSSDGPEVTIIDGNRTGTVVLFLSGEGPETSIQGFTITGGVGSNGGGMWVHASSSPTIADCVFRDNIASIGGGMLCLGPATVTGCRFEGNTAFSGGGMRLSSGTVSNCIFNENVSTGRAAAISASGDAIIADTLFIGNTSALEGGALSIEGSISDPTVIGCVFSDNHASNGAAIHLGVGQGASASLTDCYFIGNSASQYGGAMKTLSASSSAVANCSFINNAASNSGGGLHNHSNSDTAISGSLFCGNDPDDVSGPYDDGGGNQFPKECPAIGGCCIQGICAVLTPDLCTSFKGVYQGNDTECEDATCSQECPADLDGDDVVGPIDLASLLGAWGACP